MNERLTRYGASRDDYATILEVLGEPRFRADQVWKGLYEQRLLLGDITNLPASLREVLATEFPLALATTLERSDGDTTKWLFAAHDGAQIETVLMRYPNRATVCVSSQAGCAMGCTFCATGQAGFERHLDTGEILEQIATAMQSSPQRVSNVVFMGMGEPLANYDATWASVERLHADFGISARNLTISTVGVVPGMRRLTAEALPVTLAVSLHAPDDTLRSTLVPLNHRYPIAEVLDAAADYAGATGRRVSFEYACIRGVNDRPDQADALGKLLRAYPGVGGAHVNLIPLNPTAEFGGRASKPAELDEFAQRLAAHGVTATIRRNRGVDIDAACGQLRSRHAAPGAVAPVPVTGLTNGHNGARDPRDRTTHPEATDSPDEGS